MPFSSLLLSLPAALPFAPRAVRRKGARCAHARARARITTPPSTAQAQSAIASCVKTPPDAGPLIFGCMKWLWHLPQARSCRHSTAVHAQAADFEEKVYRCPSINLLFSCGSLLFLYPPPATLNSPTPPSLTALRSRRCGFVPIDVGTYHSAPLPQVVWPSAFVAARCRVRQRVRACKLHFFGA